MSTIGKFDISYKDSTRLTNLFHDYAKAVIGSNGINIAIPGFSVDYCASKNEKMRNYYKLNGQKSKEKVLV